jgi:hypothetical protein
MPNKVGNRTEKDTNECENDKLADHQECKVAGDNGTVKLRDCQRPHVLQSKRSVMGAGA